MYNIAYSQEVVYSYFMSISLLVIDPQNDFCSKDGMLSVPGAQDDCVRLRNFITANNVKLNEIHVTLDAHPFFHIAHPCFWTTDKEKEPDLYTTITYTDFIQGKYLPANPDLNKRVEEYLLALENRGRYQLTIWPPHCLVGSEGFAIYPVIFDAIHQWEMTKKGRLINFIEKAHNPMTEHYSALFAEVPDPSDPSTRTNFSLIDKLKTDDMIFVGGEALSHCVANTLRDLFVYIPPQNITLLTDCTSNVAGYEKTGSAFLTESTRKGMNLATSDFRL
jgi:nicotinamidase/pyrazinamidase